ncbi:hypothetical protein H9L39_10396 [Fusarium oxysporum f. sp. albedinis]|nr:hypothetical protein H9L39_10396 [Fusarium oxysporum f. sp. albedinis]
MRPAFSECVVMNRRHRTSLSFQGMNDPTDQVLGDDGRLIPPGSWRLFSVPVQLIHHLTPDLLAKLNHLNKDAID